MTPTTYDRIPFERVVDHDVVDIPAGIASKSRGWKLLILLGERERPHWDTEAGTGWNDI